MKIYGQPTPPMYEITAFQVPVALFYGGHDALADPKDVEIILSQLPEQLITYTQLYPAYDHIDFIWGLDAHVILYPKVLSLIQKGTVDN